VSRSWLPNETSSEEVGTETAHRPILKFIKTYFLHISGDDNWRQSTHGKMTNTTRYFISNCLYVNDTDTQNTEIIRLCHFFTF